MLPSPAVAAELDFVLVEARQLEAEQTPFEVRIYVSNPGDAPLPLELSATLAAEIDGVMGPEPLLLERSDLAGDDPGVLHPRSFVELRYHGELPVRADGLVSLRLLDPPSGTILFSVRAAAPHRVHDLSWGDPDQEYDPDADLLDRILAGLMVYEPTYLGVGGDLSPVTAKLQLSAQYRMLLGPGAPHPEGFWHELWHGMHDLYLGYTQISVWDLSSPSAPFRDTSFKPAVYYWNGDLFAREKLPWDRFGMQAGLEHESNGLGGAESRSLNVFFVRPIFTFDVWGENHFTIAPKTYVYIEKRENADIDHYRGYVDLQLKLGRVDGLELTATLRKGTKKDYGSAQLDASYPLALLTRYFGAFVYGQVFYGYGDTLEGYDRNAGLLVRGGLMIVPYGALLP